MIQLKLFTAEDFSRLINWIDTKKLMYIFSAERFNYPLNHEQLATYINAEDRIAYKVIDGKSNKIIGHADFSKINKQSKSARICSVLIGDRKSRSKGFGTQIINALIRIGFQEMKLHRIDLGVFDFNKQAIKCYKKCGFEIEGLFKENIKFEDEYWSTYNMSIINNYDDEKTRIKSQ